MTGQFEAETRVAYIAHIVGLSGVRVGVREATEKTAFIEAHEWIWFDRSQRGAAAPRCDVREVMVLCGRGGSSVKQAAKTAPTYWATPAYDKEGFFDAQEDARIVKCGRVRVLIYERDLREERVAGVALDGPGRVRSPFGDDIIVAGATPKCFLLSKMRAEGLEYAHCGRNLRVTQANVCYGRKT